MEKCFLVHYFTRSLLIILAFKHIIMIMHVRFYSPKWISSFFVLTSLFVLQVYLRLGYTIQVCSSPFILFRLHKKCFEWTVYPCLIPSLIALIFVWFSLIKCMLCFFFFFLLSNLMFCDSALVESQVHFWSYFFSLIKHAYLLPWYHPYLFCYVIHLIDQSFAIISLAQ